jgi:N-acetylmuramoyl-L-alanine amidase
MNITVNDLDFVARTIMAEAEGEDYLGKVAVAAVIYNRARDPSWWGTTIIDVCLTAKQFSCWNDASVRRNMIGEWGLDQSIYRECMRAAIDGVDFDPTDGADSYFAHNLVTPRWARELTPLIIGNHTFVKTRNN